MGSSRSVGRDRILDAAERLMAERGIHGVSLREINAAAEQRNASSIQYHFGDRAGLLRAVLARHMERADAARNAMLDELEAAGRASPPEVLGALVAPLAEELHTSGGRAYLQILDQILDRPANAALGAARGLNRSLDRTGRLLAAPMRHLPPSLAKARRELCTAFLLRSLADRARAIEGKALARALPHDAFVANLADVLLAGLLAPASVTTRRRLRSSPRASA